MKISKYCAALALTLLPLLAGFAQSTPTAPASQKNEAPLFFYDQLSPYGQWLWMDPYGWVWSPNNVAAGWRPYTDGHWVYTDCGWTWVSDARDFFSTIRHEPQEWPVNGARRLLTI